MSNQTPSLEPVSNHHYLKTASAKYMADFQRCITQFSPALKQKELEKLVNEKLQIASSSFDDDQYIQFACELTLASFFYNKFTEGFCYEKMINGRKDVDFSFVIDGLTINVEVKCFKRKGNQDAIGRPKLSILGPQLDSKIYESLSAQEIELVRSRLGSIKDFIVSAGKKYLPSIQNEYNVLMF